MQSATKSEMPANTQLSVGKWTPFVQISSNRRNQLENKEMAIKTDFIMNVLLKEL